MFFILQTTLNPSKGSLLRPQNSADGIPNNVGIYISIAFILILLYVVFRVWLSLKNDKN